jgi:hypothetical protein
VDGATAPARFRNAPDRREEHASPEMGMEISYEFEFPKLETICDIDRCGSMPSRGCVNITRKGTTISVASVPKGHAVAANIVVGHTYAPGITLL